MQQRFRGSESQNSGIIFVSYYLFGSLSILVAVSLFLR